MARRTQNYSKHATDYDEQIDILRSRGLVIPDVNKAKEILSDIGYYRLGFYIHPFEITYPLLDHRRSHQIKPGTKIENVVALYYFDLDLRNILNRYLSRIEVAIRTTMIYELSNKYISDPYWFVNPNIVSPNFIAGFPTIYNSIKKKAPIKRHHSKYNGQYAPAWKTMEYMTLGNLETLYANLIQNTDKQLISTRFNEPAVGAFKTYLTAIRETRNSCAHGNILFDMALSTGIRTGSACMSFPNNTQQTFWGALRVIDYLVRQISVNRAKDMWSEIFRATLLLYSKAPALRHIVEAQSGIIVPDQEETLSLWKKIGNLIRKLRKKFDN